MHVIACNMPVTCASFCIGSKFDGKTRKSCKGICVDFMVKLVAKIAKKEKIMIEDVFTFLERLASDKLMRLTGGDGKTLKEAVKESVSIQYTTCSYFIRDVLTQGHETTCTEIT
jgi:hypothetical protein